MCLSIKINRPQDVLAEGEHLGYEWVVVRNSMAARCGYVRIPKGHPWHGKSERELEIDMDVEVHGGVTFTEPDVPCDKAGEDDAWWVGFDCLHGGDAPDPELVREDTTPGWADLFAWGGDIVRTQEYAEAECISLIEQASGWTALKQGKP